MYVKQIVPVDVSSIIKTSAMVFTVDDDDK